MSYELLSYNSSVDASNALADSVANALKDVIEQKDKAVLAVSGGKSPIPFFEALSKKELDWTKVQVTLVDERMVVIGHDDSNTQLVKKYLLNNKAAAANWVPLVSEKFEEAEIVPENIVEFAVNHYLQPDVLVLGMGADGHTASLFPGAPQLDNGLDLNNENPLLHVTPIIAPYERISMTLRVILASKYLFLSIQGIEKKEVFDQAVIQQNKKFPISYVLTQSKVKCHVYYTK